MKGKYACHRGVLFFTFFSKVWESACQDVFSKNRRILGSRVPPPEEEVERLPFCSKVCKPSCQGAFSKNRTFLGCRVPPFEEGVERFPFCSKVCKSTCQDVFSKNRTFFPKHRVPQNVSFFRFCPCASAFSLIFVGVRTYWQETFSVGEPDPRTLTNGDAIM